MSQRAVERLLGRLLTDPKFRRKFYADATATCDGEGLDLTPQELDAVHATDETVVRALATRLDAAIVRAVPRRQPARPDGAARTRSGRLRRGGQT